MTVAIPSEALQTRLFINGEFVEARSGQTFTTINPATEEPLAEVAAADPADVDAAVQAARAQMEPGSEWQRMKPRDRGKILWKIADLLAARAAEIGRIETLDNGKPIFESQFVDVPAAAECLYYFAGWAGKVSGDEADPLVCPRCGAVMKIIAFITERQVIRAILASVRRSTPSAAGSRHPPPPARPVADGVS